MRLLSAALHRLGLVPALLGCVLAVGAPAVASESTWLRVDKSARMLTVFEGDVAMLQFPVALGGNPVGPKREQGDQRTPEGTYVIINRLAESRFHRALHVSYPNLADQTLANVRGVDPGGQIMIHGIGSAEGRAAELHPLADWTDGCIALTDAQIDVLWERVSVGTPVEIVP